jgi:hypothetical protein
MKVGLFFHNATKNTGPGKVARNLIKGLLHNEVTVEINKKCSLNGCLQAYKWQHIPPSSLVGPNILVVPNEMPFLWDLYKNHVVPSGWVKSLYEGYEVVGDCNIDVWSVGIDTELFSPRPQQKERDCFIYFKNRNKNELRGLEDYLTAKNISYDVIKYGMYSQEMLMSAIAQSKFCVLLTNTESQGIAYMEILASNIPCYVINKSEWLDLLGNTTPASSTPYFDETCGVISQNYEGFDNFLDQLEKYTPREYILKHHTLKQSAQKYLELLEKSHVM